ncbi:sigma-70 family RNA polymerase sigma factor [Peribacillus sp. SCS-155]|uniref:sigma-70 family RNA polymerase sigma factor n=1 Tax=Peribacillus sedimenti TaxID=3115297 RepID=UPI0039068E7A
MAAFSELADSYTPMIGSIIRKLSIYKNKEDYFQIGLEALWEAHTKYEKEKGVFSTYAYSMIRGRILIALRNDAARQSKVTLMGEETDSLSEEMIVVDHPLQKEILLSYCTGLTDCQTKWVVLAFLEQKTISEIANECGVTATLVKSWRQTALAKMKQELSGLQAGQ